MFRYIPQDKKEAGYCLCIETICEGKIAGEHDAQGRVIVYPTIRDAQVSLAEDIIERLTLFLENKMDFDAAIDLAEYIVEVSIEADGLVHDAEGHALGFRAPA